MRDLRELLFLVTRCRIFLFCSVRQVASLDLDFRGKWSVLLYAVVISLPHTADFRVVSECNLRTTNLMFSPFPFRGSRRLRGGRRRRGCSHLRRGCLPAGAQHHLRGSETSTTLSSPSARSTLNAISAGRKDCTFELAVDEDEEFLP